MKQDILEKIESFINGTRVSQCSARCEFGLGIKCKFREVHLNKEGKCIHLEKKLIKKSPRKNRWIPPEETEMTK